MNFTVRLFVLLGVFFVVAGTLMAVFGNFNGEIAGSILLYVNAVFFFFIAVMIKAAPAMEFMREHREASVDRELVPLDAPKEELAPPPPPPGVHIPPPSYWPAALAASGAVFGLGLVFTTFKTNFFITLGAGLLLVTTAGWTYQAWKEREDIVEHEEHAGHGSH